MRGSLREVNEKDLFYSRCQTPCPSCLGARLLLADKRQWRIKVCVPSSVGNGGHYRQGQPEAFPKSPSGNQDA